MLSNEYYEEIIFEDMVTFDNGMDDIDKELMHAIGCMCEIGRGFGLKLETFEVNNEGAYFQWRGLRRSVMLFYKYYSENMTHESEEERTEVLLRLRNKPSIGEG